MKAAALSELYTAISAGNSLLTVRFATDLPLHGRVCAVGSTSLALLEIWRASMGRSNGESSSSQYFKRYSRSPGRHLICQHVEEEVLFCMVL